MTVIQIIGLVVVLLLTILGGVFIALKSKEHSLIKWTSLFFLLALALTYIFEYGTYNGTEFANNGYLYRAGITDIPNMIYYAVHFATDKILFLLALGCFYAVLSRSEGYKKLVTSIASRFKGLEILFVVLSSFVFTIMGAFLNQTFICLTFAPFIISIILHMNLGKLTAFLSTFGSILVGLLGTVYGGDGLYWFNYYTGLEITSGIIYRVLVLVIAFFVYNILNVLYVIKVLKEKKTDEVKEDPYAFEKVEKGAHAWPIVIIFAVMFILIILGYVSWSGYFKIEVFNKFHTWLTELTLADVLTYAIVPIIIEAALIVAGICNKNKKTKNILTLVGVIIFFAYSLLYAGLSLIDVKFINSIYSATFGNLNTFFNKAVVLKEFLFFKVILGSLAKSFGEWDMYIYSVVLFFTSIIVAFIGKIKFNDFITSYGEGVKKVAKSVGMFILIYMIMMAVYFGMTVPTINDLVMSGVSKFNPFLTTLMAVISSIFHTDFGFTGYAIGTYYATAFADKVDIVQLIFTTIYGLIQFVAPTSAILMIGLAYLKIDYKTWMKHIWIFALSLCLILLILFTLSTYVL